MISAQLQAALGEATERVDRMYRQEALDFWKLLLHYVKKREKALVHLPANKQFGGFVIGPQQLRTQRTYPDIYVVLAAFGHMAGVGRIGSKDMAIILPVLKEPFETKNAATWLSTQRDTFVHEFIHYLDHHRFKGKVIPSAEMHKRKGIRAYYNTPQEFNAYYQMGAGETLSFLRNLATKAEPRRPGTLRRYLKDFRTFEKKIGRNHDFFDQNFVDALNRKYKRKFLQRLYGLYQEIVKELGTG
jgi:hypothetical protein